MKRRKFLLGVGSAAAAGSALIGSGAFSRVESERSVEIAVAEDPDAYLGLDKCPNSANGSYAWLDEKGHLEILMNPDNPTIAGNSDEIEDSPLGEGVNSNSTSWFDRVFQIRNQGKEAACVWIDTEDGKEWPVIEEEDVPEKFSDHVGDPRVDFYVEDLRDESIRGEDNSLLVEVGGSVCVGIRTKTYGLEEGDEPLADLENKIQINADVDGDCAPPGGGESLSEGIRLGYEDRGDPSTDSRNPDYNDFLVDVDIDSVSAGGINGTTPEEYIEFQQSTADLILDQLTLTFTPRAAAAGDDHPGYRVSLLLDPTESPALPSACEGDATLTIAGNSETKSFNGGPAVFDVFDVAPSGVDNTKDLFEDDKDKYNAENNGTCDDPEYNFQITLDFDPACEFNNVDLLGDPGAPHGQNLFFDPRLFPEGGDLTSDGVGKDDEELLVAPQTWKWPIEGEPGQAAAIFDAYARVEEANDGSADFPSDSPDWRFDPGQNVVYEDCS